ncbi:MAG: hypothetical protein K9M54_00370 [Kiritimatiellales bacterium]|nr:hypothetical protein [Kiritimatiellales bacterium]
MKIKLIMTIVAGIALTTILVQAQGSGTCDRVCKKDCIAATACDQQCKQDCTKGKQQARDQDKSGSQDQTKAKARDGSCGK